MTTHNEYALAYYHEHALEISRKRAKTYQDKKNGTYVKHKKVCHYADSTITRRQAALYMGLAQHTLTNIVSRTSRFDVPERLTSAGRVEYKVSDLDAWMLANPDIFDGSNIKQDKSLGTPLSNNVMLVINWVQATAAVSAHCSIKRFEIASKALHERGI